MGNYYHSSYDDMYAHHDSPRHSGSHSHHTHAHSPSSSYPSQDDPNVEHEVIIQHHHYPAPSHGGRLVTHGGSEYQSPSPSVMPTVPKKPRHRSRTHYQAVRASSYDAPKTEYAAAEPSLYDTYSSPYKASDYKSYAVASSPIGGPSDDYGIEAYSPAHSGDYGSPATYQNQPSYKVASHSYSPPSPYTSTSSGTSSYSAPSKQP